MQNGKIKSNGAGHEHKFGFIETAGGSFKFLAEDYDGDMASLQFGQRVEFFEQGGRATNVRLVTL